MSDSNAAVEVKPEDVVACDSVSVQVKPEDVVACDSVSVQVKPEDVDASDSISVEVKPKGVDASDSISKDEQDNSTFYREIDYKIVVTADDYPTPKMFVKNPTEVADAYKSVFSSAHVVELYRDEEDHVVIVKLNISKLIVRLAKSTRKIRLPMIECTEDEERFVLVPRDMYLEVEVEDVDQTLEKMLRSGWTVKAAKVNTIHEKCLTFVKDTFGQHWIIYSPASASVPLNLAAKEETKPKQLELAALDENEHKVDPSALLGLVMSQPVQKANVEQTLEEINHYFEDISGLPVIDEQLKCIGVISKKDKQRSSDELQLKVGEVMSSPPITLSPNDTVVDAAIMMIDRKIHRIPIVNEEDRLVGIVTRSDIVKALRG